MDAPTPISMNDGHSMPQLGFGTWKVGGRSDAVVLEALRAGYRSIDTAAAYANEEGVGLALAGSGIAREELFVATKLWNDSHGYDRALRAFDESVRRLGLDYLDLYLIHWPVPKNDLYVDAWKALIELRKEGRVRSIGVSNFNADHLERIIDATGVVPAVNQVELHPAFQQRPLRAVHERLGIRTESWSPLGRGAVLGDPAVAKLAGKHGRTPAQVVLRWHLEQGIITIPKSSNPERMRENLGALSFRLDAADMDLLAALDTGQRLSGDPETFG